MQIKGRGKRALWTSAGLVILSLLLLACEPTSSPTPDNTGPGVNRFKPNHQVIIEVHVTNIDPPIWKLSLSTEELDPQTLEPFPESRYAQIYNNEDMVQNEYRDTLTYNSGIRLQIDLLIRMPGGRATIVISDGGRRNQCGPKTQVFPTPGVMSCSLITNR